MFDGFLNSLLDVAHAFEVSRNFRPICGPDLLLQFSHFLEQRVENATFLLHPRAACGRIVFSPNKRSKAALGDCSIGSGAVGPAHEIVPAVDTAAAEVAACTGIDRLQCQLQ